MNFRDEYKKEISEISPDEAALERIRSGVAKKLAEPEAAKKKPLPLRRIAVIGGSVAACLVIGVTAIALTGDKLFDGTANNMMAHAPTAAASGGNMAGGANAAPNPGMSSRPNFDNVNGADCTDQGGLLSNEDFTGNDGTFGTNGAAIGEFSPDASIPAGSAAEEQEPSSSAARITLDGDMLTLEYNGKTTVFRAPVYHGPGKDSESDEFTDSALSHESGERISVIASDGEKMFLELQDGKAVLFDSENNVLGIYVKTE